MVAAQQGYDRIKASLNKAMKSNDAAGFGPLAKFLPRQGLDDEGRFNRTAISLAVASYLKEVSGAAVTEQEYERINDAIVGGGTVDEMMTGLNAISFSSGERIKQLEAQQPGMVEAFHRLKKYRAKGNARSSGAADQAQMVKDAAKPKPKKPQTQREKIRDTAKRITQKSKLKDLEFEGD